MSLLRTFAMRTARRLPRTVGWSVRSVSSQPEISIPDDLTAPLSEAELASGDWVEVRVPVQEATLEWVLSSPPPLHAFDEPPLYHECTDEAACTWHNPLAH